MCAPHAPSHQRLAHAACACVSASSVQWQVSRTNTPSDASLVGEVTRQRTSWEKEQQR
jgi:hypothetical protein